MRWTNSKEVNSAWQKVLKLNVDLEIAKSDFKIKRNSCYWSQGKFTLECVPCDFLTSPKTIASWTRKGIGPKPSKSGFYSIKEMHNFLWCTDISEFTPKRRIHINEIRRQRITQWFLDIEYVIGIIYKLIKRTEWTPGKKWHFLGLMDELNLKEKISMFKTTADLRAAMVKLYEDVEKGHVTASVARTKVQVAKTIVDTIKVEIAAANLGKQFGSVRFDDIESAPALKQVA